MNKVDETSKRNTWKEIGTQRLSGNTILAILTLSILMTVSVIPAVAYIPTSWIRTDNDIFYFTGDTPKLFGFESNLFTYYDSTLYRFKSTPCSEWKKLNMPPGAGQTNIEVPSKVANVFYISRDDQLWYIKEYESFSSDWKKIVSTGIPSGAQIVPMILFNGQLYAAVYPNGVPSETDPDSKTFDIYRSSDFGKIEMTWNKVASNGFGDANNHQLGTIIEYKKKLIAITDITRSGFFGSEDEYGTGVEVWESPTGDENSWNQVNKDGFGTEITVYDPFSETYKTFRPNQDFGSTTVYNDYLYIGTLAHYGGQVWRYDGNGLNGWTDVTPSWIGPKKGPGRAAAMATFQNYLYMGEGYPTANLDSYDGTNWIKLVYGPHPFDDPANIGIYSLAVINDKIYASVRGFNPAVSQIWGYPFLFTPATCSALTGATISITPKSDTNELGTSSIQIHSVKAKVESNGVGVPGVEVNFNIISGPNAGNVGSGPTLSNGEAPFNYTAKQGLAGLGTDVIEACFTDVNSKKVCTQATKKWVDTTPPVVKCLETSVNKKTGSYELTAKDAVDPNPKIFVIDTGSGNEFGPFTSGTTIQYTVNPGKPKQKKNDIDIKGNGKPAVRAVDSSGNEGKASCTT